MKLQFDPIPNWRQAWKWSSVHAMAGAAAVQGTWLTLSADMKQHIPAIVVSGMTIGLVVLGIVGRLRDQTPKTDAPPIPTPPGDGDVE